MIKLLNQLPRLKTVIKGPFLFWNWSKFRMSYFLVSIFVLTCIHLLKNLILENKQTFLAFMFDSDKENNVPPGTTVPTNESARDHIRASNIAALETAARYYHFFQQRSNLYIDLFITKQNFRPISHFSR